MSAQVTNPLRVERDNLHEIAVALLAQCKTMRALVLVKYGNLYPDINEAIDRAGEVIIRAERMLNK